MVRAKFRVSSITRQNGSRPVIDEKGLNTWERCETQTITMHAVADAKGENAKFWAATPGGKIELNCVLPEAVKEFDLDGEFYVDFTLAPETS